jgi:hypothetical protein
VWHGLFRFESLLAYGSWLGHNSSILSFAGVLYSLEAGDCAVSVQANVGTMHAGDVSSIASHVVMNSKFLRFSKRLADCVPEKTIVNA